MNKRGSLTEKRRIVWIFWDDDHISELYEKWIYCNIIYAYARFEELHTHSGEVLCTKEHKAAISKDEADRYINIDDLKIFKDFSVGDKTTFKTKIKARIKTKAETNDKNNFLTRDILDKISNKMNVINKLYDKIDKIEIEVTEKIESIYESMHILQNGKYDDQS